MCLAPPPLFRRNNMDIILSFDSPQLALHASPSPSLQPSAYSPFDLIVFTNFNSTFRLSYRVYGGEKAIFYFFHSNLRWEADVLSEPTPKRKTSKTWTVLVVQLRHLSLLPPEIGRYGNLCPLSGRTTSCFRPLPFLRQRGNICKVSMFYPITHIHQTWPLSSLT